MVIKILLLLLVAAACAPEVKISNKLESLSQITEADVQKYQKTGLFLKSSTVQIQAEGKTYNLSKFSSKDALDFAQAIPVNSQVPIIFTGGYSGTDVVVETIKRQ